MSYERVCAYRKVVPEFRLPEIKLPTFLNTGVLWNACVVDTDDVEKYNQMVEIIFNLSDVDFSYLDKEMILTELAYDVVTVHRTFNPFITAFKNSMHFFG